MTAATVEAPAAQVLTGGLLLPRPVAGHPALELCNTVAGWGDPRPRDYLASYAHLVALTRHLDLLTPSTARDLTRRGRAEAGAAARVLAEVRRLRADLYAALTHHDSTVLPRLNRTLSAAAAARRIETLTPHGARWSAGDAGRPGLPGLRLPLTLLAWQAHRLLDDAAAPQVRRCPGDGCGWLFLDPRGQRRWCVMSLCGNRAKARRHGERARSARA